MGEEVASTLVEKVPELPVDNMACTLTVDATIGGVVNESAEALAERRQTSMALMVAILPRARTLMGPKEWRSLRKVAQDSDWEEMIVFVNNSQHL